MIDLKPFCAPNEDYRRLTDPFNDGDYTYATNSHICVRVPRRADCERTLADAKLTTSPGGIALWPTDATQWQPLLPVPEPVMVACPVCGGKRAGRCWECGGCGIVEFENDFNEYTVDCKTCDGEGAAICKTCDENGQVIENQFVDYGPGFFKLEYLMLVNALPAVQIAFEPHGTSKVTCLQFRFDGGEGVLMGCQRPSHTKYT